MSPAWFLVFYLLHCASGDPQNGPYPARQGSEGVPYVLTPQRLAEIRAQFMYPYSDTGGHEGEGDLEKNIKDTNPQINKQLNFLFPFFGFGYNYTWLSLHGFLSFSDSPDRFQYPLKFPIPDWPNSNDPSFIGPWYSRCRIGALRGDEADKRTPGVYFRLERDLAKRLDQFGIELRERLKWDLRESMVGTEGFEPRHAFIATWKNVSFAGGFNTLQTTNTFQAVITTDEVRTYAIFNYQYLTWTTSTEAGGDINHGLGGTPAFVGFNAGNGTRGYEYKPYSQGPKIMDLLTTGNANKFPGRHVFRIDENILSGVCRPDYYLTSLPLTFAPENGNMLGGTMVNISGPCFKPNMRIQCRFYTVEVTGVVLDQNRAACIMPRVYSNGYIDFAVAIDGGPYYWKGRFLVETPLTTHDMVWFQSDDVHTSNPTTLEINWDTGNLTANTNARVQISVWGYREKTITPDILYIDSLVDSTTNIGKYTLSLSDYDTRNNYDMLDMDFGFIQINVTNPVQDLKMITSPQIWSKPIPLAWYFRKQWERQLGRDWIITKCYNWIYRDRNYRNFAGALPMCPCLLKQAVADRGRFAPDFSCDMDGNSNCFYHQGARHCVRTGMPNTDGAGQQCCYDKDNYLMMSSDNMWGGNPQRVHNIGMIPWNEVGKVPSLSYWYQDMIAFYSCCMWQQQQSDSCERYRFERRASQDCRGYQPPAVGTVFGDPHFYTFDGTQYTFNGKGEFVLTRVSQGKNRLDVQVRFEQVPRNFYGPIKGTTLTSVVAADNSSTAVEVRLRPRYARWRYHLDVIVQNKRVYFDRPPQKIQNFRGVTVYTPSNVLNQSQVVIMFPSGAGVEVIENMGHMSCRVYLPMEFVNKTTGLLGNWSYDATDDFTLPDGTVITIPDARDSLQRVHESFAMKWVLEDKEDPLKGKSMFYHDINRPSTFYYDKYFQPEFRIDPGLILPKNVTVTLNDVNDFCGDSYQCKYDYAVTLDRDRAFYCKYYQDSYVNIKLINLATVVSCGSIPTPKHGRKSTFAFIPNTMVKFDCDPGYVLVGDRRRWCYASGEWNYPEGGEAHCVAQTDYQAQQAGIATGIVLAVIIPLIIIGVLIYIRCRQMQEDRSMYTANPRRYHSPPVQEISKTSIELEPSEKKEKIETKEKGSPKEMNILRKETEA